MQMSEWLDNKNLSISGIRQLLLQKIKKSNPRRELTSEEVKRLAKLESPADKLRRGENVQNRQLETCLSYDKSAQIEVFEKMRRDIA